MQYYSVSLDRQLHGSCMKGKHGKMIDARLLTELDVLKTDLSITRQKLDSKTQAVAILHQALEQCKKERDEFQQMAEQVMNRYQLLRKTLSQGTQPECLSAKSLGQMPSKKLAYLLVESREANRALERELVEMNVKLSDAEGDIKLLRQQLRTSFNPSTSPTGIQPGPNEERQNLISHLERLTAEVTELERELSRCADEKQELLTERDIYRNKCDRLNNELNYVLHGDERKIVDIDTLIMEKKSLKYRLQAVEEERNLAMSTLTKYKKMLERKFSKSSSVGSDSAFTPNGSPHHPGLIPASKQAIPDEPTPKDSEQVIPTPSSQNNDSAETVRESVDHEITKDTGSQASTTDTKTDSELVIPDGTVENRVSSHENT